jgi:hypothetical protein
MSEPDRCARVGGSGKEIRTNEEAVGGLDAGGHLLANMHYLTTYNYALYERI